MEQLLKQTQKQTAMVAGVNLKNKESMENFENSIEELINLADACDISVVGQITQRAEKVNIAHYLGKGKIDELIALIAEKNTDMVIFNDELSGSQIRNLEEMLDCRVIDRTVLILDIFAQRAKTKEAKLQVEVAKLQYMLPRLTGQGEALSRQGGGSGLKNRGAGETKLELDRRKIGEQINILNKELEQLVSRRKNQRAKRAKREIPVVALVGYTNAGKSTVMNAMIDLFHPSTDKTSTDKKVFEKNMLFATLETSVRSIKLPDNKKFLLTDTVGFISKLPHNLVKAFRSTLEEVAEADLLIHVVDFSNPNYEQQIQVTNTTLKDIGIDDIPMIYACNKTDLLDDNISTINIDINTENSDQIYISAKYKKGVSELVDAIKEKVFTDYIDCRLLIPHDKGNIVSYLNEHAHIKETKYENEGTLISLECKQADYQRYQQYLV
ncbi:GTPase HflX [Desulfuribacillus alkaliarsenatis]|uniref:GTPase HflX n=1 Tax=Desulfuribacillus alkaliarsenatis TaxID=766136 RepID=A0A1E5G268_9FIRM|nr:GTPase HflX [Desulfuribacillus alkaliarsenatis]OEF97070.1 GTPase HflX [Desulfuribacillus alkaliarsenatis]